MFNVEDVDENYSKWPFGWLFVDENIVEAAREETKAILDQFSIKV
jgi:hypothetical protein